MFSHRMYNDLSSVILDNHKNNSQKWFYEKKIKLRQTLNSLLKDNFDEQFDLYVIGSTHSQFGLKCSNLDLCLVIYDASGEVKKKYFYKNDLALEKLNQIQKIVVDLGLSCDCQLIGVQVPKLRFVDKDSQIIVEININRLVTVRNTFLLSCYNGMDRRVAPLVVAVKCWARKNTIPLSSYSLTLMVIHFLQNGCYPPVVPQLPAICGKDVLKQIDQSGRLMKPIDSVRRSVSLGFMHLNNSPLGALFTQFLHYYTQSYAFNQVISINSNPSTHQHPTNRTFLIIEDPFERENTANSVNCVCQFEHIKQTFLQTLFDIQQNSFDGFEY